MTYRSLASVLALSRLPGRPSDSEGSFQHDVQPAAATSTSTHPRLHGPHRSRRQTGTRVRRPRIPHLCQDLHHDSRLFRPHRCDEHQLRRCRVHTRHAQSRARRCRGHSTRPCRRRRVVFPITSTRTLSRAQRNQVERTRYRQPNHRISPRAAQRRHSAVKARRVAIRSFRHSPLLRIVFTRSMLCYRCFDAHRTSQAPTPLGESNDEDVLIMLSAIALRVHLVDAQITGLATRLDAVVSATNP